MALGDRKRKTSANQVNSRLLRLPPELRLEIYALALANSTLSVVPTQWRKSLRREQGVPRAHSAAALLLTCRQTHHEASPILFKSNTIDLHHCHEIDQLRGMIGKDNCRLVTSIAIEECLARKILCRWRDEGIYRARDTGGLTALKQIRVEWREYWMYDSWVKLSTDFREIFGNNELDVIIEESDTAE